ncbi:MAG: hypothetical protein QNJ54_20195 [Prochloraceae cyanobacterium]|nr:hypothetical protein [Prochloraceae cyanobacterium]
MRDPKTRYSGNSQDWLFFTPTLGDNWSHLVENECWRDSDNCDEAQERELENKNQKRSPLGERLVVFAVASSVLLAGSAICLQIPYQLKTNTNSIENSQSTNTSPSNPDLVTSKK